MSSTRQQSWVLIPGPRTSSRTGDGVCFKEISTGSRTGTCETTVRPGSEYRSEHRAQGSRECTVRPVRFSLRPTLRDSWLVCRRPRSPIVVFHTISSLPMLVDVRAVECERRPGLKKRVSWDALCTHRRRRGRLCTFGAVCWQRLELEQVLPAVLGREEDRRLPPSFCKRATAHLVKK